MSDYYPIETKHKNGVNMDFIDALNNKTTRGLIDQIEDIESSLQRYKNGEAELERIRQNLIKDLSEKGYNWS